MRYILLGVIRVVLNNFMGSLSQPLHQCLSVLSSLFGRIHHVNNYLRGSLQLRVFGKLILQLLDFIYKEQKDLALELSRILTQSRKRELPF